MKIIKLKKPFQATDGRKIAEIKLRDPSIGDIEEASKKSLVLSQDLDLLALVVQELPPDDVRKLSPKDFEEARKHLRSFLE